MGTRWVLLVVVLGLVRLRYAEGKDVSIVALITVTVSPVRYRDYRTGFISGS